MVTSVTSFGRSGLADFVLQRVSAVVLAAYGLCVIGFFISQPVTHAALTRFFGGLPMRAFTTLALAALAVHAWIGMWTVGTDYVRKHYFGRGHGVYLAIYQFVCWAMIFVYVVWPLAVIWGFA